MTEFIVLCVIVSAIIAIIAYINIVIYRKVKRLQVGDIFCIDKNDLNDPFNNINAVKLIDLKRGYKGRLYVQYIYVYCSTQDGQLIVKPMYTYASGTKYSEKASLFCSLYHYKGNIDKTNEDVWYER